VSPDPTLSELRQLLGEAFSPKRLLLRRAPGGGFDLRMLSDRFTQTDNPLALLEDTLAQRGARLPEQTLTLLKAPDDLEEGEEEILFSQPLMGAPTWADALTLEPVATPSDDRGFPSDVKVVAFWGLKGGVGRSTALAHIALLLGRRQVPVLAIDLDLESPALAKALCDHDGSPQATRFDALIRQFEQIEADASELRRNMETALLPSLEAGANLSVLGPLHADADFVRALLGPLAPGRLYRGRPAALRRLLQLAVSVTEAQVVLLDARSGYCDESAMAVLDLADEVVLFASPSPSTYPSFAPAIEAMERNRRARGRPGVVHVAAGMLPAGEQSRTAILAELQNELEDARAQVAVALATPPDELPADIVVTAIDYSARIVENDGALRLSGVTEGYRDLADRILPPPLPDSILGASPQWVATVLGEARIPVSQAESEPDSELLARLFTRTPDLERFLRPDTFLVRGPKGSGKSYLRRICLEQPQRLSPRHGIDQLIFVDGYSAPRAGRATQPPINQSLLRDLAQHFPTRWSEIWSALSLGRVLAKLEELSLSWRPPQLNQPQHRHLEQLVRATRLQDAEQAIQKLVTANQSLALADAWRDLDTWLQQQGRRLILLFDDLDVALGESDQALSARRAMLIGLLDQANSAWFAGRNLGARIFLRSDLFNALGAEEQAKYRERGFELAWRPDDLWRLVIRSLAVGSPAFEAELEQRRIPSARLDDIPRDDWTPALELIWGERMGGRGESNTRTTTWAEKRLRDSAGRLFPRAALWLLDAAIDHRRGTRDAHPPLLDAVALRAAMPRVSENRLDELLAESDPIQKQRVLRLKSFKSYQNRIDFIIALRRAGDAEPEDALKTLEALGVVEAGSRRDKTPTTRIVDLYAFAPQLDIQRLGRR